MSVEKILDKLDEKISYLIRNLGLIITVLFGFTAIIYNVFGLNLMLIIIMIILFSFFLGNIIYSLHIYINKSSNLYDFIYELQLYEELLKLLENIRFQSSSHILNIREIYSKLIKTSNTQKGGLKLIYRVKDRFEYWKFYDNEKEECKLLTKNIAEHQKILRLFIEIFSVIQLIIKDKPVEVQGLFKGSKIEKEKKEQERDRKIKIVQEYMDKLQDYNSKLSKFRDIKLIDRFSMSFSLNGNIIFIFVDYLNAFYKIVEATYLENLREIDKKKEKYKKSIRKCYIFYGITIFLCILITIVVLQLFGI